MPSLLLRDYMDQLNQSPHHPSKVGIVFTPIFFPLFYTQFPIVQMSNPLHRLYELLSMCRPGCFPRVASPAPASRLLGTDFILPCLPPRGGSHTHSGLFLPCKHRGV